MVSLLIILFFLGACFWSFGWVLLKRLHQSNSWDTWKSILRWRSFCFSSKKTLPWYDLIPIVSYLILWWKSRFTGERIPFFYFLIELFSGIVFMMTWWFIVTQLWLYLVDSVFVMHLIFWLLVNWLLLLLIIYDIDYLSLHIPIRIMLVVIVLIPQFFWLIGNYQIAFYGSLIFWWLYTLIYFWAQRYVYWKYGVKQEWFWQWDVLLWAIIWALAPFHFIYTYSTFDFLVMLQIALSHILLSSLFALVFFAFQKIMQSINWIEMYNHNLWAVVPFFPAMIIAYWILICFFPLGF